MKNEKVYEWLKAKGFEDRITEHSETIDTVEHAAQQIGCTEAEIADGQGDVFLVRVDNADKEHVPLSDKALQ